MIQLRTKQTLAVRSLILVVCSALLSFSEKPGGDSYAIYLGDKVLLKAFVHPEGTAKNIVLGTSDASDVLKVHYSHCGKTGLHRSLAVVDVREKVLKAWSFIDGSDMELSLKDVVRLSQNAEGVKMVYSSLELPEGKVLASITVSDGLKARR